MKILLVLNHHPYDGTDITWNALRLAKNLQGRDNEIRIFLMNDAVDLARDVCKKPEGYDKDLVQDLKNLIKDGAKVEVCGGCMARCGIYKNEPYYEGANKSTMNQLAEWVLDSDKALTF